MKRRLVNLLLSTCIVLTTVSQGSGAVLAANAVNIQATVEEPMVTTGKTIYVDHSMATTGSGSSTSPYKDFTTALTRAADGDTIIIKSKGAYVGVETGTELLPLVINKAVTIIGEDSNSFINIRSAGILLEADVTIRNLNLSLSNKCHAAICANGYRLELDNVTYENGSRKVHVFAGKMTEYGGDSYSEKAGTSGQVIIKGAKTKLGNIYAGSMNSSFDLPVTITIEGATNMQLGAVYACGALEGVYDEDNFLDYESEPTDPTANASEFPMTGQVSLQVSGTNLSAIDGKMNESGGQADLTFSTTVLENRLDLSNIRSLTVTSGELQPSVLNEGVNLSVNQDAVLDLSTVMTANNNGFTVKDFTGGGTLKVGIADALTVTGNITGSTAFETTGSNADGSSGIVYEDYGYIDVSSAQGDGIFTFQPHPTQSALVWEKVDGVWRAINPNQEETGPVLTGFQFEQEEHTAAIEEIDSEGGIAIGTTCSFKEDGSWPDLGNIPFSYEVQCFGYTYTQKSQGEDGWYQASIPALNLRFEPNGDDVNGANLWVYAIDDAAQIYPGEYLIKLKVPEANGGQESTIKLTIVGDDPGTVPEAPEASDKTAPVITALTASEVTENTAVVTATASDDTEVTSYQLTQTAGEGQASIQETETKGVFQISNLTSSTAYTFTVTVKDKAGNTSTKEVSFTTQEAAKIDLSAATVTVNGTYTYTGNALTPAASDVVVTLNGSPVDASQYTITVTNNVNAGTATVTVEGKDGYSGSAEGTFTIGKAEGSTIAAVTGSLALEGADNQTYRYTVTEIEGAEYRMDNGIWQESNVFTGIVPGSSHTFFARMKETANTLAGEAKATTAIDFPVINDGNQEDTIAPTIASVTATEITAETAVVTVTASDASGIAEYALVKTTGEGEVTVTAEQTAGVFHLTNLTPATDYTFTATVIDGAGNKSSKMVSFRTAEAEKPDEVEKIDLSKATVTVKGTYTYTGKALIPAASNVVVTLNGNPVDASQYSIVATNNIHAGTATVTVEGKDGYMGKAAGTFTIGKAAGVKLTTVAGRQTLAQDGSKTYTYTITKIEGAEYRMDNGAWQSGNIFEKIAPGSSHTFFARMKETADTLAGEAKSTGAVSFALLDDNKDKEPVPTIDITKIFSDVKEGDWFKDAVAYVYTNKIMTGMGNSDKFNPQGETTRAMVVKILHNAMEGPASSHQNPFVDVPESKWYEMPVRWALENGITTGTSPTEFAPDRSVTRQEVASFLYRYGEYRGFDVSMTKDISSYPDQGEISTYARKAMAWANATGIITGKGGIYLDPQGTATRAEIAAMVQRFEARYE